MLTKANQWLIRCAALACAALVAFQAERAMATPFTNSNQLLLSDNLAAVNFYYNPDSVFGGNTPVTSAIQGVMFDNLNVVSDNNVAFSLTGGGTLTADLPNTTAGDGRSQGVTAITGTGADTTGAQELATAISYFAGGETGTLSFSFGAGNANVPVYVQLVGGDQGWVGTLTASVNAVPLGSFTSVGNSESPQITTFTTTTDAGGDLLIDLAASGSFVGLAGVIVSVPEPSSFAMLLFGSTAMFLLRRKRS